jgi:hypothetical protein
MSDNDTDQPRPPLQWVESPHGIFEIYANLAHITWSLDDVRIRLAQMVTSKETRTPGQKYIGVAEERAAVTLTWRNAKVFRDNLILAIENYEKTNGEIKTNIELPPSTL